MTTKVHLLSALLIAGLYFSSPATAELNTTGQLKGSVATLSGEPIANASIKLQNMAQGIIREVQTDADGKYIFKGLLAGNYQVMISHADYESAASEHVEISIGASIQINSILKRSTDIVEDIVVIGTQISALDMQSGSSGIVITSEDLQKNAIAPDAVSIALKAPGVNQGDEDMGYLPSFGGASQGENAYFLNGLNITNIRSPFGYIGIPIEAVQQTSVEAGGISARYGRFTGGAVNQVSKSGTNEWHYGVTTRYEPASLGETQPSLIDLADDGTLTYHINNKEDSNDYRVSTLYASGPIVKDKAFIYALGSQDSTSSEYVSGGGTSDQGTLYKNTADSDSIFLNLDWYVAPDHSLGLMVLEDDSSSSLINYQYSPFRGIIAQRGLPFDQEGSTSFTVVNYNGQLGALSIAARFGRIESESEAFSGTRDRNVVWLRDTDGRWTPYGNWSGETDDRNTDARDIFRIDFEYETGDHTFAFGYDQDETESTTQSQWHGPNPPNNVWYYVRRAPFDINLGFDDGSSYTAPANTWWVSSTLDYSSGNVMAEGSGYYLEDLWQISDTLTLKLGLRNDIFTLNNAAGEKLYKIGDQWAPRLGLIWDVFGTQKHKAYANFGRYYVPMPPSMSFNLGVPGLGIDEFYLPVLDGSGMPQWDSNDLPVLGTHLGTSVFNNGTINDPRTQIAENLDPMYNDEWLIGYEISLRDDLNLGARYVQRKLGELIEDTSLRNGMLHVCTEQGWTCDEIVNMDPRSDAAFRLINPGADVNTWFDLDGDGTLENVVIPNRLIGMPAGRRDYRSIELYFDSYNEKYELHGSYVNSRLYGNSEGFTRTDSDSTAAGQTSLFNYAGTMEYATGLLPNHHKHTLKFWGHYRIDEHWYTSFALTRQSGRPMNEFGFHPNTTGTCAPGGLSDPSAAGGLFACPEQFPRTNFFTNGQPSPRGTAGNTPWVNFFDAGLGYECELGQGKVQFDITVFNIFSFNTPTQKEEWVEDGSADTPVRIPFAGAPNSWQPPRYVALTARYDF